LGVEFLDRFLVFAAKLVYLLALRFEGVRPVLHCDLTPLTQLIDVDTEIRRDLAHGFLFFENFQHSLDF